MQCASRCILGYFRANLLVAQREGRPLQTLGQKAESLQTKNVLAQVDRRALAESGQA